MEIFRILSPTINRQKISSDEKQNTMCVFLAMLIKKQ